MRDEDFNRYRLMFPQSKVWKIKTTDQPARPVGPPQPTGQTGQIERSDCSDQPVRLVEPTAELAAEPVLVPSVDKAAAVPLITEDEELVDYEVSPECTNLEINVVHLFRITSWFQRMTWLIFSLGPVKQCSRSQARRTTISKFFT